MKKNYKACSQSLRSTKYESLKEANTQAAEQVNKNLRRIGKSAVYMNPEMYMRSLTIFMAYNNVKLNNNKF